MMVMLNLRELAARPLPQRALAIALGRALPFPGMSDIVSAGDYSVGPASVMKELNHQPTVEPLFGIRFRSIEPQWSRQE
jgi:hypothetical protein